jgi:hypothetical protein
MGEVETIVPKKDRSHIAGPKLFTALIYTMITHGKYALARYVPRNSKTGVTPRLVALIPYRGPQYEALYLIDLPTIEDVRDYPFNPLKPCTPNQR